MSYNPRNIVVGASNQTATSGTLVFSNSNSITFGMSNSSVMTASYSQSNQQMSVYAVSNTVATNSTSMTANASSLDFAGAGIVSIGAASNGSVVISATAPAAGSLNISAGTTSNNLTAVTFSNSNGVSFGLNGSTVTGSVAAQSNQQMSVYATGNTTGSSSMTVNASSFDISGAGIVSVGASAGSVIVSAPANPYISRFIYPSDILTNINAISNGFMSVRYLPNQGYVTGTRIDGLFSVSSLGSAANTNTVNIGIFMSFGIYSLSAGTVLNSLSTATGFLGMTYQSSTGNYTNYSAALFPGSAAMNINMTPGEYYVGMGISTATAGLGTGTTTAGLTLDVMGGGLIQNFQYAEFGSASATSENLYSGMGQLSVTTSAVPTSIALSNINQAGGHIARADVAIVIRNY